MNLVDQLQLEQYLPPNLSVELTKYLQDKQVLLTISNKRKTKLGDYRLPNSKTPYHRVSVNGTLNQYAFLITLIHEFSHLEAFEQFGKRILPHGKEWKMIFGKWLKELISRNIFPEDISKPLAKYSINPKASSVSDPQLMIGLRNYDVNRTIILNDLSDKAIFQIGKRIFEKGTKKRTRFLCKELNSSRLYLVSGLAEVSEINKL